MDIFIEKIQHIKGLMLGVSISALILAPFAILISLYLVTHKGMNFCHEMLEPYENLFPRSGISPNS